MQIWGFSGSILDAIQQLRFKVGKYDISLSIYKGHTHLSEPDSFRTSITIIR